MYFIRMGGLAIVGSSPEMLVRVEGRRVETHPIAGTRPRGATTEEDLRLGEELKRNEKERAEHVMLVDLGRNDLGRVCEFGTVRVPQYMALERYSHVMHLVSTVDGRLAEDQRPPRRAGRVFPGRHGVRRAEDPRHADPVGELEPTRRDVYAGAVGYIDFAGNLDFCIAIRTITIRDGVARVQAGAGHRRRLESRRPSTRRRATRRARCCQALAMAEEGADVILLIDNYDSFTYNLAQYLGELGAPPLVARNDEITLDEIDALQPDAHRHLARAGTAGRRRASRSTHPPLRRGACRCSASASATRASASPSAARSSARRS